jgi:hypothetical protein
MLLLYGYPKKTKSPIGFHQHLQNQRITQAKIKIYNSTHIPNWQQICRLTDVFIFKVRPPLSIAFCLFSPIPRLTTFWVLFPVKLSLFHFRSPIILKARSQPLFSINLIFSGAPKLHLFLTSLTPFNAVTQFVFIVDSIISSVHINLILFISKFLPLFIAIDHSQPLLHLFLIKFIISDARFLLPLIFCVGFQLLFIIYLITSIFVFRLPDLLFI